MRTTKCGHNFATTDGESVCVKCGFVEDTPNLDDSSIYDTSPVPPLYLSQSIGTGNEIPKGNDTTAVKKFFKGGLSPNRNLSCFSNVCLKLDIPKRVQQEAWTLFASICKAMPRKVAEHACIAIFHTCRKTGTAKPGNEIIDAVRAGFGRKTLPTMTKMTYQHMHVLDYDSSRANEDRYYFSIVFNEKTYGLKLSESAWAGCGRLAWYLYTEVYDWDDNYRRRARRATDQAFAMVPGYGRRVKQ